MWLAHFNPNHDPKTGKFTTSPGGTYIKYKRRPNNVSEVNHENRRNDQVLKKGTVLSTYSFDKDRTKDTEMFYALNNKLDKFQYDVIFNTPVSNWNYTKDGKRVWNGFSLRYKINNKTANDMKVASEDSGSAIFKELYTKDKDFYEFVTDPNRMLKNIPEKQFRYDTYNNARKTINRMSKNKNYVPTEREMNQLYTIFNYSLPYDGTKDNNLKNAKDSNNQRTKFFASLKDKGYGAVLDTNDAAYNRMNARSPIIVFDMENIIPKNVRKTYFNEKRISGLIYAGSKILNK